MVTISEGNTVDIKEDNIFHDMPKEDFEEILREVQAARMNRTHSLFVMEFATKIMKRNTDISEDEAIAYVEHDLLSEISERKRRIAG